MQNQNKPIIGRGAAYNPPNRFEPIEYIREPEAGEEEVRPHTRYFKDASKSFITYNDSPDVGFRASINPYRGCEHGCVYCYGRPTHEYMGFSAGLDFETIIFVKEDGPELLDKEFRSKKWQPQVLGISGVTDPYQPIERQLQLTRRCLEVCLKFRNPVGIVTKNHLVTRDADILSRMAEINAAVVFVSITTLNDNLRRVMEPRTSSPRRRLEILSELSRQGIPCGVLVAPVIPALTDHELPKIIEAAAAAGARFAGYIMLRLPFAVAPLFEKWLENHYPDRKEKVLNRIREIRGGKLNDPRFKFRMRGEGLFARQVEEIFKIACRKAGILNRHPDLSTAVFRIPGVRQLNLF